MSEFKYRYFSCRNDRRLRNSIENPHFVQLDTPCVQELLSLRMDSPLCPTPWKTAGPYFEACNCDVARPCIFLSPPTSGDRTLLVAWHIDQGRFEQIDLDGLNAVLAVYSPAGRMLEVKWKATLCVDERGTRISAML